MKAKTNLQCVILVLILLLIPKVMAAPPLPPCIYYGYVTVGGKPAQDGLNVTAMIDRTTLNWTTETKSGTYGWPLMGSNYLVIPGANDSAPQKDGGATGDRIAFYIEGVKNVQTTYWDSGTPVRFDLSIPEIPSQPGSKLNSSLTVSLDCPVSYAGYKVKLSGTLALTNGTGISDVILLLTYMNQSETLWANIGSVNTTSDGNYYAEWTPPSATGDYLIKVSWEGNETVEGAEANISVATTTPDGKYVFSVISTSIVYTLAYNSTSRVLSFIVAGPSGTMGYANVTMAKDLMGEINGLRVYLDQSILYYTATSTDASWMLHFVYPHSTHDVAVNLGSPAVPLFRTLVGIAIIFAVAVLAAAILFGVRRKLRRHHHVKSGSADVKAINHREH